MADLDKLKAYSKYLDENDPKDQIGGMFDKMKSDNRQAVDIAQRGGERTPEEQQLVDNNLGPLGEGLVNGGVMGGMKTVASPIQASALTGKAVDFFPKMKQMFQVGEHVFPAGSTAEAMKIRDALEATGKLNNPGANQIIKLK